MPNSLDRRARGADVLGVPGLLHDIGHSLATVSYLVDSVRADLSLSPDVRTRIELLDRELAQLLELVGDPPPGGQVGREVDVREILQGIVSLKAVATTTRVTLVPGPPVRVRLDGNPLWRMTSNIVDNAIRAAGPDGIVSVAVTRDAEGVAIEVTDDGPGFGGAGPASATLGLSVVAALARSCGATVQAPVPGSDHTLVRVVLPARPIPSQRAHPSGVGSPR